jgi:hypothetical protein
VQSFFTKMATLIVLTIVYSVVIALFWFMPLMSLIGPEGDGGSLELAWAKLTSKAGKPNEEHPPL